MCWWSSRAAASPASASKAKRRAATTVTCCTGSAPWLFASCAEEMAIKKTTTNAAMANLVWAVKREVLVKIRRCDTAACQLFTFVCFLCHALLHHGSLGSYAFFVSLTTSWNADFADVVSPPTSVSTAEAATGTGGDNVLSRRLLRQRPMRLRLACAVWISLKNWNKRIQMLAVLRADHTKKGPGHNSPPENHRSAGMNIARKRHCT
mmetsp:Transcript_103312/g.297498  ORF Transcript_103312/g.297498 Transcript_103312/m.297498 type:complete len:207 (-) Transcript_103312:383-1003(-)